MDIFISWSGERSRQVADALYEWIPLVIQAVKPWMSNADIERGDRWSSEIATSLEKCKVGLVCLTPENLHADWIHFEAGALSKITGARVVPLLVDLEPTDVDWPLAQFQATRSREKDEVESLMKMINSGLLESEKPLPQSVLTSSFSKWWPDLDTKLSVIPKPSMSVQRQRLERELLEEILSLVRMMVRFDQPGEQLNLLESPSGQMLRSAGIPAPRILRHRYAPEALMQAFRDIRDAVIHSASCPNCDGVIIDEIQRFCHNCGYRLQTDKDDDGASPSASK